jgi:hypothetical protein
MQVQILPRPRFTLPVMDSFPCVSEARVPGSIPGGSTLSRISPEWEAVCKAAVAGSTPERDSIFGGGAHAMDPPPRLRSSGRNPGATRVGARPGLETPQTTQNHLWMRGPGKQAYRAADKTGLAHVSVAGVPSPRN